MQKEGTETKHQSRGGIVTRHSRKCAFKSGRCNCEPSFRAWAYDKHSHRRIWSKSFPTQAAAKSWRVDTKKGIKDRTNAVPTNTTILRAAGALTRGMKNETILRRGGEPYKPSVRKLYRGALKNHILPRFGAWKVSDLGPRDVQAFVKSLTEQGLGGSAIRGILMPLRVIYREARYDVPVSPLKGVELPADSEPRERVASPTEAAALIAALPESDRALWATAFYAGLRRGELRGLRWSDVDLADGLIRIERSIDGYGNLTAPKSKKGTREVGVVPVLREHLIGHKKLTGRDSGLVFGSTANSPFTPSNIRKRALTAWKRENAKRTEQAEKEGREPELLEPIGLHECRHSAVTLFWEAGLSLEEIGDYVGHSSTYMTDRYRHLREGRAAQAARKVGDYLARADTGARLEQLTDDES
jgi:integrase